MTDVLIASQPDNRFLTISNRNAKPGPRLNTLATFVLREDGSLSFHQLASAGGTYPRHYSMDATGRLVAIGSQYDKKVVIMERDPASGLIGRTVAELKVNGNVTCVVFDEQKALGVLGG